MTTLDIDFVREQFPSFAHPETGQWAHLENAGGSYCPRHVVDLVADLFAHGKCQPEWDFGPSVRATRAMQRSRAVMAELFNAAEDEIHFGPSTSQNTYVLAKALRPMWNDGDEIIVTNQDHEANGGAWRRLADTGIIVKEWRVDGESGLLDPADLDALITDRTRLLAVTHASNIAATINPVRELADRLHAVGGHIVVDGVSYAPHGLVDVQALDCDVYLYSTYKTYGPHVGLMYTRRSLLEQLHNESHYFKAGHPEAYLTPAGPDHAAIGAVAGVADYYDALVAHHGIEGADRRTRTARLFDAFGAHEEATIAPLVDLLLATDSVRLVGAPTADQSVRAPTIAFHVPGRSSASIYDALIAARVSCGHGNFYAHRLMEALGLDVEDGVVRLSAVHYNTDRDVARACDVLDDLL
ncbi:MAG: aminotransferase class V-fold PLP-dependent enzyme [Actinomycetota bacterium]